MRKATTDEPFAALAFKIATTRSSASSLYIQISGHRRVGARSSMPPRARKNGWALFQMHSNKENLVDRASAGHIYAVIISRTPPPVTP